MSERFEDVLAFMRKVITDNCDQTYCAMYDDDCYACEGAALDRLKTAHEHELERERDQLQAKLDEAEFAIANWREREKSFDASERMRDELRERLDRVADALRGVERGTMSAWEAADEVGR